MKTRRATVALLSLSLMLTINSSAYSVVEINSNTNECQDYIYTNETTEETIVNSQNPFEGMTEDEVEEFIKNNIEHSIIVGTTNFVDTQAQAVSAPKMTPEEQRAIIEQWLAEYPGCTIGIDHGELVLDTRPLDDFSSEDTLPYMPYV